MPTTLDKQPQGTNAKSEEPSALQSTMSTSEKQDQGTSAPSEEHDVTGLKKTINVLDSPASEEAVHGRSDSVSSSHTTSGLELPHGSVNTYEQESAPEVDSSPAPSVASSQPSPSPKQAGKQDTQDASAPHSMGGKSGDLKAQYKGLPVDTSSSSRAGRDRYVSNPWGWIQIILSILLGLLIAGIGGICVTDRHCLSVGMQKSTDLACQAGLGVSSAYTWMLYTAGQVYQSSPALQADRASSRQEIGSGLDETYTELSQALVARNCLHNAPELLIHKRGEAMQFRLPDDSLISKYLGLFLQLTEDADEEIMDMTQRVYQVAKFALRQQKLTTDKTLSFIQQRADYWRTFGPFRIWEWLRIFFMGTSTEEAQLQSRLKDQFELMYDKITVADASTHKVLQRFYRLASTTENIRESCLEEEQRLLVIKGETASHLNWIYRVAMQYNILPELEDIAVISRNVELADSIHEWSKGVIQLLEQITTRLKHAKFHIGSLMEILRTGGTLKWTEATKNAELMEFLAQIADGFALLVDNSDAWDQLQLSGQA